MIGYTNTGSGGVFLSNNKPIIHINTPLLSTVEIKLNGITLAVLEADKFKANIDGESADCYYLVNTLGEYTITATYNTLLSEENFTKTVNVTANEQYDVVFLPNFILFKDGHIPSGYSKIGGTDDDTVMQIGSASSKAGQYISPVIDVEPFVAIEFDVISPGPSGNYIRIGLRETPATSSPTSGGGYTVYTAPSKTGHYSLDITTLTYQYYFNISAYQGALTINNVVFVRKENVS